MKLNRLVVFVTSFMIFFSAGIILMGNLQSSLEGTSMRLGIDLYPRWVGSEAILEGESPYSLSTRQKIWTLIYASPDFPKGNPFGFYYPPAVFTLIVPFLWAGISVKTAVVFWCALLWALWAAVIALLVFELPLIPHKALVSALLAISGLLFRPAFSNYLLGQYALLSILMFGGAWLLYKNDRMILAGVCASLSLIKPSLTFIPMLFFLLFYRNYRFIFSFLIAMVVLYIPPTILLGWWVPDFIRDISRYSLENNVSWFIGDIATPLGIIWLCLSVVLIIWGISIKDEFLVIASSLTFSALLTPHSADYDLIIFIGLITWMGYQWFTVRNSVALALFLSILLIWFPWIALFVFLQSKSTLSVETWYRFIWLVYPILVLMSTLITQLTKSNKLPIRQN